MFCRKYTAPYPVASYAYRAAPEGQAFSGERTRELVCKPHVLPKEKADLSTSDTHVSRRNVDVRSDVAKELAHETLTKAHDLPLRLAMRVEIRAALAATHGKTRQTVLERLFKTEELENRLVHVFMETQSAFVRTDRSVELHAPRAVDADVPSVVLPCDPKDQDTVRLGHPLEDSSLTVRRISFDERIDGVRDLADRLDELWLVWVTTLQTMHEAFEGAFAFQRSIHESQRECTELCRVNAFDCGLFRAFEPHRKAVS